MKYQLPPECCGVTLDGVALQVADGLVEADAAAASALSAHGVRPAEVPPQIMSENKPDTLPQRRGKS